MRKAVRGEFVFQDAPEPGVALALRAKRGRKPLFPLLRLPRLRGWWGSGAFLGLGRKTAQTN